MKKKALLIGINYQGTPNALNGCENDVFNIKKILTSKLGYSDKNITVMTEKRGIKPTKKNILNQISKLINSAIKEETDEIWFHYSGHGTYIRDANGDEIDGKDECLCPLDSQESGLITDDLLHKIFSRLPEKTNCICIMDCCHSGSILDLKYRYVSGLKNVVENKNNSKCNIISISGCRDNETSADALIHKNWVGAMTTALIKVLEATNYSITCNSLLLNMRKYLSLSKFSQVPQICSSYKIDHDTVFCSKNGGCSFVTL